MLTMSLASMISASFPSLGMISPMISTALMNLIKDQDLNEVFKNYWWMLAITAGVYYLWKKSDSIYNAYTAVINKSDSSSGFSSIQLFEDYYINMMVTYMNSYKQFYQCYPNMDLGELDPVISKSAKCVHLSANQSIPFTDSNFNVSGIISVIEKKLKKENGTEYTRNCPKISIIKTSNISALDYVKKMEAQTIADKKMSDAVNIRYFKTLVNNDNKMIIHTDSVYSGNKIDLVKIQPVLMQEFFHPDKEQLLVSLTDTCVNKQDQFSKLFHGPPGTGKSSFVYRAAMLFQRDIVSIDLTCFKSKADVYRRFSAHYDLIYNYNWKSSIILLEEIDIVFDFLQKEHEPSEKKKTGDYPEPGFGLRDLLELIQGPVPMNGRVIIATTNRFEEIKKACPAMFRSGRLEPVKFDYLESKEINEMIKYHFPDNPDMLIDFNPNIATSQITGYIKTAKLKNDPSYFIKKIKSHKN